jgi:hypothetical protein
VEALDLHIWRIDHLINDVCFSEAEGTTTVLAAFMAASDSEAQGWRIQDYNFLKRSWNWKNQADLHRCCLLFPSSTSSMIAINFFERPKSRSDHISACLLIENHQEFLEEHDNYTSSFRITERFSSYSMSSYSLCLFQSAFKLRQRVNQGIPRSPEFASLYCNVNHSSIQGWTGECAELLKRFIVNQSQAQFRGVLKHRAWFEDVICGLQWPAFCVVD